MKLVIDQFEIQMCYYDISVCVCGTNWMVVHLMVVDIYSLKKKKKRMSVVVYKWCNHLRWS